MAKNNRSRLTAAERAEAKLNDPDLDDDGNLDVETFPIPGSEGIDDPYLAEVWDLAIAMIDQRDRDAASVPTENDD